MLRIAHQTCVILIVLMICGAASVAAEETFVLPDSFSPIQQVGRLIHLDREYQQRVARLALQWELSEHDIDRAYYKNTIIGEQALYLRQVAQVVVNLLYEREANLARGRKAQSAHRDFLSSDEVKGLRTLVLIANSLASPAGENVELDQRIQDQALYYLLTAILASPHGAQTAYLDAVKQQRIQLIAELKRLRSVMQKLKTELVHFEG